VLVTRKKTGPASDVTRANNLSGKEAKTTPRPDTTGQGHHKKPDRMEGRLEGGWCLSRNGDERLWNFPHRRGKKGGVKRWEYH